MEYDDTDAKLDTDNVIQICLCPPYNSLFI